MDAVYYGLTATGAVLLIWYYIVWWQAERPKAGTLEWIDRWERPSLALPSCGKALCRADALWALAPFFVAACASILLQAEDALYGGSLGVIARFPSGLYLSGETVCAALAAAAAYLAGKALTGRTLAALAGALLYAVKPTDELTSCLLLGAGLLLWLWAAYPRRAAADWALLLCGSLLAGAAVFSYYLYGAALAFAAVLAFLLLHRVGRGELSIPHALLRGACALCAALAGFFAASSLIGEVRLFAGEYFPWLREFLREEGAVFADWLRGATLAERLPVAPMLLSGLVPLCLMWKERRDGAALYILLWAVPVTLHYVLAPALFQLAPAALVCAYLTGRLLEREQPVAAWLGAAGAIAVLGLQDILWNWLSMTFYF